MARDVMLKVSMSYGDDNVLLSETINVVDEWNQVNVYLLKRQTSFHLAVKSRPSDPEDLIAIDDFSMVNCQPPSPSPDNCSEDKFKCENSK